MVSFIEDVADAFTATGIDLLRLEAHTRRLAVSQLRLLEAKLVRLLHQLDLEGAFRQSTKVARAERMLAQIRETLRPNYRAAAAITQTGAADAGLFVATQGVASLNKLLTVDLFNLRLNSVDLRAIARRETVLSLPMKEWWDEQLEGTRKRFTRAIRQGILQGQTTDELIQRVRGDRIPGAFDVLLLEDGKTRRIPRFSGGILATTYNHAETAVRTAVQSVANKALDLTLQDNADLLRGRGALVTLDAKTSEICMARSGASWDFEGKPLPESTRKELYPGPPPWHRRCRTALIAILKSWTQLVEEHTGVKLKKLNEIPGVTRASMDGHINLPDLTFDAFLRRKGDVFAARKLGPTKFRLWREGKITLSDLLDQTGRPLTNAELISRFAT